MIHLVPDLMQLQMDLQELANDAEVLRDRVAAMIARQQKAEAQADATSTRWTHVVDVSGQSQVRVD